MAFDSFSFADTFLLEAGYLCLQGVDICIYTPGKGIISKGEKEERRVLQPH